jgi:hypothetical protein
LSVVLTGIASVVHKKEDTRNLLLVSSFLAMMVGAAASMDYFKKGAWGNGKIVPAVVVKPPKRSGGGAAAAAVVEIAVGGNAVAALENAATVRSWWEGKARTLQIPAGTHWRHFEEGRLVWIIRPRVLQPAQFVLVAAPTEWESIAVPREAAEWLQERLAEQM